MDENKKLDDVGSARFLQRADGGMGQFFLTNVHFKPQGTGLFAAILTYGHTTLGAWYIPVTSQEVLQ